jgi:hypothetical protein
MNDFSVTPLSNGFVLLSSLKKIRSRMTTPFRKADSYYVETTTGWNEVTFIARADVNTKAEWKALGSRLQECLDWIDRCDDGNHTLTGQLHVHCKDILERLGTSESFRVLTNTAFSEGIKRSLVTTSEALESLCFSIPKQSLSAGNKTHMVELESCLSALIQSHELAETMRGAEVPWPDNVKVANIEYLGKNKPACL